MSEEARIRRGIMELGRLVDQRNLGGLHGVTVYVRGQPLVQHHWAPDIRRDLYSVSKTLVSLAIGIAQGEGRLSTNDLLLDHLGQLAPTAAEGIEQVTIQQLLTMTSGIVHRWDDITMVHAEDPAQVIAAAPLGFEPGTEFAYRGGSTYLLSRIIHACSGQDVRDFLQTRVFTPLGIADTAWQRCPLGLSIGAVGLSLRTQEVARIGELLLDGGRWGDRQLIPDQYVNSLISDPVNADGHRAPNAAGMHPEIARYGRHVWLSARDDAWRMDGIYGQFCVILPHQQACIAVAGHYQGPTTDILEAIWTELVPAIR